MSSQNWLKKCHTVLTMSVYKHTHTIFFPSFFVLLCSLTKPKLNKPKNLNWALALKLTLSENDLVKNG